MGNTYDFEFETVKVRLSKKVKYAPDRENGGSKPFSDLIFKSVQNGVTTSHRCYQTDPLKDVEKDAKLINSGMIQGTNFYKHWMKLFFVKGQTYDLLKKETPIKRYKGIFVRQHNYKENTFYFEIEGKEVEASGFYYEFNNERYLL